MVKGESEHVLLKGGPEQQDPQQGPPPEIERPPCLLGGHAPQLFRTAERRQRRQIDHRQRLAREGFDLLGLPSFDRDEGRSERLVPAHQRGESGAEEIHPQITLEPHGRRHVVGRAGGRELGQEPEPLLSEREGEQRRSGHAPQRRQRQPPARHPTAVELLGQLGHGRALQDLLQRHRDAQKALQPRRGPDGEERVPPQAEEAVGGAHPGNGQHVRPDLGHELLGRSAGRDEHRLRLAGAVRQSPAVDLAVERPRQHR